jgi:hypothetical protein
MSSLSAILDCLVLGEIPHIGIGVGGHQKALCFDQRPEEKLPRIIIGAEAEAVNKNAASGSSVGNPQM